MAVAKAVAAGSSAVQSAVASRSRYICYKWVDRYKKLSRKRQKKKQSENVRKRQKPSENVSQTRQLVRSFHFFLLFSDVF